MSKFIIAILFSIIVLPLSLSAQGNPASNKDVQSNSITSKSGVLELKSKLVDEYGVNGFRFIKSGDQNKQDIKNSRTLSAKELSEVSALDEYTIIIILAAIGAIAVILFIFK